MVVRKLNADCLKVVMFMLNITTSLQFCLCSMTYTLSTTDSYHSNIMTLINTKQEAAN